MMRLLSFIVLFLMFSDPARAGSNTVQRIGIEQGLSQSTVMSIVQDREGFLWFGTWDGLNRYDGYSFIQYRNDPADSTTISHNSIRQIFEDRRGNLWIGTAMGGLNRLDRKTNRFIRYHSADQSKKILLACGVYMINEDSAGRVWVQTSFGLEQYDTAGRFVKRIDTKKQAVQQFTKEMCRGGLVYLWQDMIVGTTAEGAVMSMPVNLEIEEKKKARRKPDAASYLEDAYGTSWVASYTEGLFEFDWNRRSAKHRFRHTTDPGSLTSNFVRTLYESSDKRLWIGTDAGLCIARRDADGRIEGFDRMEYDPKNPASLNSGEVNVIYEDRSGVIWVGTKLGAIKILPVRKKFIPVPRSHRLTDMLHESFAIGLFEESDSALWIGSLDALTLYDPRHDTWKSLTTGSGLTNTTIYFIHQDKQRRIWIGTSYGLNRYDAVRRRFIPYLFDRHHTMQLYMNRYYAVSEDADGILWLGTANGMLRFDPNTGGQKRIYFDTIATGEGNSNILSVLADADTVWVGVNNQGVLKMDRRTFAYRRFQHNPRIPASLSNNQPMSIFKDSRGTIWVATLGGGLNRLDPSGDTLLFRHFSIPEGLRNSSVYGILEGEPGMLWVSTNDGIARFDTKRERFTIYTEADGLPAQEYNQNSFHRGRSGMLYFGGVNGIVRFRPEEITVNTTPPPVAVTGFSVFNEERNNLLRAPQIELPHTQNFFSFEFAALCFEVPENNRYAYKLEGLEEEWNDVGTRRFANYTDVDPGEYVFRVKGTNNDGVWNEQGASVRIIIVPPYYATLWFRLLAVIIIFGSIIGGVRYSAYQKYRRQIEQLEQQRQIMEERQRTRDKIARDLHDDLASTVGSAGLFVETAKRTLKENAEQSREYLDKTSAILNEAEEAMSDIVWSVSPKYDSLHSLATRIRIVATDLCRANGIACTVEVNGNIDVPLGDDVRRGFYLIFKEGLNNVLKHSRATAVVIGIGIEQGRLILRMKDNGIGFTAEARTERRGGNGMSNIRKRADEMGGAVTFESAPGKGTLIEVVREMTQLGH